MLCPIYLCLLAPLSTSFNISETSSRFPCRQGVDSVRWDEICRSVEERRTSWGGRSCRIGSYRKLFGERRNSHVIYVLDLSRGSKRQVSPFSSIALVSFSGRTLVIDGLSTILMHLTIGGFGSCDESTRCLKVGDFRLLTFGNFGEDPWALRFLIFRTK